MQIPIQITFHQVDHSDALDATIREKIARLEKYFDRIIGIRVVVELASNRHRQGNLYHVRVDLTLPGHEIVVGHNHADRQEHEDPYIAVRDTFLAVRRQLEDYVRIHFREKNRVSRHSQPTSA